MNRIVTIARVGGDGVLSLALPVGVQEANNEVQVTVDSVAAKSPPTREEWEAWVDEMSGSWQGEFERPPQGQFEVREPLP